MQNDIEQQLQRAIAAARSGDRTTARQMLREVIVKDPRNEKAWLWLATTSTSRSDKEKCLNRVLKINPNNQKAKEALEKLQATPARSTASASNAAPSYTPPPQRSRTVTYTVYATFFVALVLIVIAVVNNMIVQANRLSPAEIAFQITQTALSQPTVTNTPTITPTATLPAVFVTLEAPTLPPTFTPTPEPTATETPLPTATPIPLDTYTLLYSSIRNGDVAPQVYQIVGDGSADTDQGISGDTVAVSPDGRQVAFIAPSQNPEAPANSVELFVAPINNLQAAEQLTTFGESDLSFPTWHPGGEMITLVQGRDTIIGVRVIDPAAPPTVYVDTTIDEGNKMEPTWAPDGLTLIYASDVNAPGFPQIYAYHTNDGELTQLSDDIGSNYSPEVSPDGSKIVFISDRSGDGDVYTMNADGSNVRLLTSDDGIAEDQHPTWADNGQWLAFSSNRANGFFHIFIMDSNGNNITQVTRANRNNLSPVFVR